jgi:hypothetical protein
LLPEGGEVTSVEEPAHAGETEARHRTSTAARQPRMTFLLGTLWVSADRPKKDADGRSAGTPPSA